MKSHLTSVGSVVTHKLHMSLVRSNSGTKKRLAICLSHHFFVLRIPIMFQFENVRLLGMEYMADPPLQMPQVWISGIDQTAVKEFCHDDCEIHDLGTLNPHTGGFSDGI